MLDFLGKVWHNTLMEIENVKECIESAMSDFFFGEGYIDGSVAYAICTREDMQGKSQMTELQETITERIINFDKEKD